MYGGTRMPEAQPRDRPVLLTAHITAQRIVRYYSVLPTVFVCMFLQTTMEYLSYTSLYRLCTEP